MCNRLVERVRPSWLCSSQPQLKTIPFDVSPRTCCAPAASFVTCSNTEIRTGFVCVSVSGKNLVRPVLSCQQLEKSTYTRGNVKCYSESTPSIHQPFASENKGRTICSNYLGEDCTIWKVRRVNRQGSSLF